MNALIKGSRVELTGTDATLHLKQEACPTWTQHPHSFEDKELEAMRHCATFNHLPEGAAKTRVSDHPVNKPIPVLPSYALHFQSPTV